MCSIELEGFLNIIWILSLIKGALTLPWCGGHENVPSEILLAGGLLL